VSQDVGPAADTVERADADTDGARTDGARTDGAGTGEAGGVDGAPSLGSSEPREAQRLEPTASTSTGNDATTTRPRSATRRVRARIARRITAQRTGPVKPVLEPLATIHRELHPSADLATLQRAYDTA
jgi:GTP diphosphokinase / guanosine-3',5'-bis(diphosphate) 3'-diphosphatase